MATNPYQNYGVNPYAPQQVPSYQNFQWQPWMGTGGGGNIMSTLLQLGGQQGIQDLIGQQQMAQLQAQLAAQQRMQGVTGQQTMEQIQAQLTGQTGLQKLSGQQAMEQIGAQQTGQQALQGIIGQQALAQIQAQLGGQMGLQELGGRQAMEQIGAQQTGQQTLQNLIGQQALAQLMQSGQQQRSLQELTGSQTMQQLQSQQSAQQALQQLMGQQQLSGIGAQYAGMGGLQTQRYGQLTDLLRSMGVMGGGAGGAFDQYAGQVASRAAEPALLNYENQRKQIANAIASRGMGLSSATDRAGAEAYGALSKALAQAGTYGDISALEQRYALASALARGFA